MKLFSILFTFVERIIFSTRKSESVVEVLHTDSLIPLLQSQTVSLLEEPVIALLPYQNPIVKACIHEAKFYAGKKATQLLADVLRDFLTEYIQPETELYHEQVVCVPLPLSPSRKRSRGYNQVEQILSIARENIDAIEVDTSILSRTRDTAPQAKLAKQERLTNMIDAFQCQKIPNEHTLYIIIDDVATTGATLKDAKRALAKQLPKSSRIILLALSH